MDMAALVHTAAHRDFWDWAIAVSTLVVAVIAGGALLVAIRARGDLVRERRADFNLNVLRELADEVELAAGSEVGMDAPKIRVRLRMVQHAIDAPWMLTLSGVKPDKVVDDLRIARFVAITTKDNEERRIALREVYDSDRENVLREIKAAIRQQLNSRPKRGLPWLRGRPVGFRRQ